MPGPDPDISRAGYQREGDDLGAVLAHTTRGDVKDYFAVEDVQTAASRLFVRLSGHSQWSTRLAAGSNGAEIISPTGRAPRPAM